MKNKILPLSLVIILALSINSATSQTKIPPQALVTMNQFLATFLDLQPFMVSDKKIETQKEREKISNELKRLARLSVDLRKMHSFESTGFKISAELLTQELKNASRAFANGNLGYARRSLRSTLDVCSSCHSQVPQSPAFNWKFDEKALKGSDIERAEFLFATRQYAPAEKLFYDFAKNFKKDQNVLDVERGLVRILAIHLRAGRNPNLARKKLLELSENQNFSSPLKERLAVWITELRALERLNPPDIEKTSAGRLVRFVSKRLDAKKTQSFGDSEMPDALYFSGLLYQFLNTRREKDVIADLLYWLALYEKRLGENYPQELSRLYFKECVLRFSKDPTAKLCFQEYESMQNLEYTGSSGTKIPLDVKRDLESLRNSIEPK